MATTEVMALTSILPSIENFSGGENDILDLSALSSDLVVDSTFNALWDRQDQSTFVEITSQPTLSIHPLSANFNFLITNADLSNSLLGL